MAPSPATTRSSLASQEEADSHAIMARYLFRQCGQLGWVDLSDSIYEHGRHSKTGVAILRSDGYYTCEPFGINHAFKSAVHRLQVNVAISISSEVTIAIFSKLPDTQTYLTSPSLQIEIPILDSFDDVGYNKEIESKSPIAYLLRQEQVVLVTSTAVEPILNNGRTVEAMIMELIWGAEIPSSANASPRNSYRHLSIASSVQPLTPGMIDEKNEVYQRALRFEDGYEDESDEEVAAAPPRILPLTHMFVVCLAVILMMVVYGLSIGTLINEWSWDGFKLRFILAGIPAVLPFMFFSLFLVIVIASGIFELIMPISVVMQNTKFHSAQKPKIQRHRNYELPHITIQMPVYKEGLKGVIVPTIVSLLAAIRDYESRGGTASIYVNDDGMQLVEPDLAEARKHYYESHGIGYCARPPSKQNPPKRHFWQKKSAKDYEATNISPAQALANSIGFVRKGKFKKASNMNYCLDFSCRVEDELQRIMADYAFSKGCTEDDLTVDEDDELYQQALANIIALDEGRTVAGGNVRIGELILIVDCDTRVPVDCLVMGALEMHESPEVAVLQHGSGVMQVVHNLFENAITFFTNLVYTSIQFAVGTGDIAPFVGHNAFLRWKAIQSVAFVDPSDGLTKWWSDAHVSEDFDLSLRLQMAGNICRLATYHGGEFKEGVSLTVYDELARWEKYAYGCSEYQMEGYRYMVLSPLTLFITTQMHSMLLIETYANDMYEQLVFHPFYKWPYKGPITKLFLRFLWSNMPVTSKFTVVAYITTYYAIGAGFPLSLINYVIFGLYPAAIDHFYLPSWKTFVALLVIFNGLSNVSLALLRHRIREKQFLPALIEMFKWNPFMYIFFGGISMHLSKALLCHMFGVNIEWTSTAKELGPTGFYIELEKIISGFKWVFGLVILISGGMIYMAHFAPWGYSISAWTLIVPLASQLASHFLLPVALGLV